MATFTPAQFAAQGGKVSAPVNSSIYQAFLKANVPNAVPVKNVSPASPALKQFIATGAAPGAEAPKQGVLANLSSSVIPAIQQTGTELKNDVVQPLSEAFQGQQSGGSAGLQTVGNLLNTAIVKPGNAILSPITKAWQGLTNVLNPVVDKLSGQAEGTTQANQDASAKAAADTYNQWASAHPEAAKDLEALGNITQASLTAGAAGQGVEGFQAGIDRVTTPQVPVQSLENLAAGAKPTAEIPAPVETPTESPVATADTLQSRIADATPKYNPKMIGTKVKTPTGEIAQRVASEGKGVFGERPVTTSASEHAAGTELNNIANYPDKGTALEKMLATDKAIGAEAEQMRGGLEAEDIKNPLDAPTEQANLRQMVINNMPEDIQAKIEAGKPLPKTAAGKYFQSVLDAADNYDGTRVGKLDTRQAIDTAYENARGKLAYGTDSQNALDESHIDIRDSINEDLKNTTSETDTQASLKKQTDLYRAKDVLNDKAQAEASSHYKQFLQKHPGASRAVRVLARQEVMIPLRILESAAGLSVVLSAAKALTSPKK